MDLCLSLIYNQIRDRMKQMFVLICSLLITACTYSQQGTNEPASGSGILTPLQLQKLMEKPECLEGYRPAQSGPLIRLAVSSFRRWGFPVDCVNQRRWERLYAYPVTFRLDRADPGAFQEKMVRYVR